MASFTILEASTATVFSTGSAPATKTYNFIAIPNGASYFDFQVLGGYDPAGTKSISLRFRVNTTVLGVFQFHRWTDHSLLVPERSMVTVPASALLTLSIPGVPVPLPTGNTLTIDVASAVASDYFFIGPLIWHTN